MLKIYATVGDRRTLFLGLSRENTTGLHDGTSIVVDVEDLTGSSLGGPVQDVVVLAGESDMSMVRDLDRYIAGLDDEIRVIDAIHLSE